MVLAHLVAEEKDGFGNALAWGLLFLVVAGTVACFLCVAPPLMAFRHGWRWTVAMALATAACGMPLRFMFQADDPAGAGWGLLSFPLWMALTFVARRGPPALLRSRYMEGP